MRRLHFSLSSCLIWTEWICCYAFNEACQWIICRSASVSQFDPVSWSQLRLKLTPYHIDCRHPDTLNWITLIQMGNQDHRSAADGPPPPSAFTCDWTSVCVICSIKHKIMWCQQRRDSVFLFTSWNPIWQIIWPFVPENRRKYKINKWKNVIIKVANSFLSKNQLLCVPLKSLIFNYHRHKNKSEKHNYDKI